jgi:hypothetical protein
MFPVHYPKETAVTSDAVEKSVGAFILRFGNVEYALTLTIIEINRIIDGTTIQSKFPYGIDEMRKFFRKSECEFLDDAELPPFGEIADELEDLNKIRTVLVHSYLSGSITKADGTWFRFERFAVGDVRNSRKLESYQVKREFIDDSLEDLKRTRSWLIQLSHRFEKSRLGKAESATPRPPWSHRARSAPWAGPEGNAFGIGDFQQIGGLAATATPSDYARTCSPAVPSELCRCRTSEPRSRGSRHFHISAPAERKRPISCLRLPALNQGQFGDPASERQYRHRLLSPPAGCFLPGLHDLQLQLVFLAGQGGIRNRL